MTARAGSRRGLRRAALAGLALVLVAGGFWTLEAMTTEEPRWATVERGALVIGAELTGSLQAVDTVQLGPPQLKWMWNFKIARLAPEGSDVTAGTPILVFDSSELVQRLEQQQAEADSAAKEIEKYENQLVVQRRDRELRLAEARARERKAQLKVDVPPELLQATELEQAHHELELARREISHLTDGTRAAEEAAQATLAGLRAQHEGAQALVAELERGIAMTSVPAPRAGKVIYVTDWRGEKGKVGDTVWRGQKVLEVPDLSRMKAVGQVHEADAGRVAEGQAVSFTLDAHPDETFAGRITKIWRTVQRESEGSAQKVVRVEVELEGTDTERMRPGMRLRGEVETDRIEELLLVPAEAIVLGEQGPLVYRETWRGVEPVVVELGRRDKDSVELLAGLEPGDRVSLEPRAARGGGS